MTIDTHIFLWFFLGIKNKLSPLEQKKISKHLENETLGVSIFVLWEIFQLEAKGRGKFPQNLKTWTHNIIDLYNLRIIPLNIDISYMAHNFEEFHKDPADRIIMATSICENLELMTHDKKILNWLASQ